MEAETDVQNVAAQKVLEKNGFKREGERRRAKSENGKPMRQCIYSISRADWKAEAHSF